MICCAKKNISREVENGSIFPDLRISITDSDICSLATDYLLYGSPDSQISYIEGTLTLVENESTGEEPVQVGSFSCIFVRAYNNNSDFLMAADQHDQKLYDSAFALYESQIIQRAEQTGMLYIDHIFLDEEYRGKGTGRTLLPIIAYLAGRGASVVTAYVLAQFNNMFKSAGFFPIGREDRGIWAARLL